MYVEGLPEDTNDREIARKYSLEKQTKSFVDHYSKLKKLLIDIFRPFPGFRQLRLIPRETKDGQKVHFAFADFENTTQTTMVINTLQGYRFHKDDLIGLSFSYAVHNKDRHNKNRNNHRSHHHE